MYRENLSKKIKESRCTLKKKLSGYTPKPPPNTLLHLY